MTFQNNNNILWDMKTNKMDDGATRGVVMGNRGKTKTTHSPNLCRLNCVMGILLTIGTTDALAIENICRGLYCF